MLFWDASALLPLLVEEARTTDARRLLRGDDSIVVWWGTAVECAAALARIEREGRLAAAVQRSRNALQQLRSDWLEVLPGESVREAAMRAVNRHPLKSADALQLGAALQWVEGRPVGEGFCTFDGRLAEAARREGFSLPLAES